MSDLILEWLRGIAGSSTPMMMVFSAGFLIIGFLGLIKGADVFVGNASGIAAKYKVPPIVIGLTIVAFGTSLPEAAVSITAGLQNNGGIAIGNVVGSNILNILLILGITSLICSLPIKKTTLKYEIPFVAIATVALLGLGIMGWDLNRIDAIILLLLFAGFMFYISKLSKSGDESLAAEIPSVDKKMSLPLMIVMIILGLALVVIGSEFAVTGATEIAKTCGVSDRVIGLTIVAFGTSLPELVTSVLAARKGHTDIAIGNIIGSNIFNILFILGAAGVVSPSAIAFEQPFMIDTIVALAAALLLGMLVLKNKKLGRIGGIVMLLSYAAYSVYLFV